MEIYIDGESFARETAEVVHAINAQHSTWTLLGFLNDNPALAGQTIEGVPVLGLISLVERYPDAALVVGTATLGTISLGAKS